MGERSQRSEVRVVLVFQDPGVFAAAALAAVDDQGAAAEGDSGQAAGHYNDFFAVEDVGSEVYAAAFQVRQRCAVFTVDERGVLGELDDGLGDEVARVF